MSLYVCVWSSKCCYTYFCLFMSLGLECFRAVTQNCGILPFSLVIHANVRYGK